MQGPLRQDNPSLSPDGRWIAYRSNETGTAEVWVQAFASQGGKWLISRDGGHQPQWSPDGRELFYVSDAGELMVASVSAGTGFTATPPRVLFKTGIARVSSARPEYAVSADGRRFLINTRTKAGAAPEIVVVLNWKGALARQPISATLLSQP